MTSEAENTRMAKSFLILGGARSGKSSYAEKLAEQSGLKLHYLATGRAWDSEMTERISIHKSRRGPQWQTLEEPLDLVEALRQLAKPENFILVDCLTLWVTNLMLAERDIETELAKLEQLIPDLQGTVAFVSNEVGLGIVPENKMARDFRDHAGFLHQSVARQVSEVYFMAAGLSLKMKG